MGKTNDTITTELSPELQKLLADDLAAMGQGKKRSMEILSVFAKHNFYAGGFTPEELRTTLEDLGPTYVKIGQIMSSRADMLPESYCDELGKLRSNVKPLDPAIARAMIEQETGRKIEDIFREFRDKPLGSASIAQAHYGVLKDGTEVVTKVQRPLIADMMRRDFVLLKKLSKLLNVVREDDDEEHSLDLVSVIDELEAVTEEELDFRIEAENTRFFKENCMDPDGKIDCPTIIDDLTTERIMTMTFVDGCSVSKKQRLIEEGCDLEEIGRVIIENFIHQVLDAGTFHGDPHQGNIMVSHGTPYWIDFGMVGRISETSINLVQDLVIALLEKDVETLVSVIMSMGATSAKTSRAKLMDDADGFVEKYMSMSSLSDLDLAVLLDELSEIMHANAVSIPGEYTMLVRALATIEGVLEELCPDLNLFQFVSDKFMERMKKSFDLKESLLSSGKDALTTAKKAAKIPVLASDALNGIVKGRTKLNLELTGYEELANKASGMLRNFSLVLFSCILFLGSCILCTTDIEPQTSSGFPILALTGFIISVALAIYVVYKMRK